MRAVYLKLDEMILAMASFVWPQGYDTSAAANESFKALKAEYTKRGRVTIFDGACEDTIYGSAEVNVAMRAWHDYCHLVGNVGFSVAGETRAVELQCEQLCFYFGWNEVTQVACDILRSEVIGQARYYAARKSFVERQREFVLTYMARHYPESFAKLCR